MRLYASFEITHPRTQSQNDLGNTARAATSADQTDETTVVYQPYMDTIDGHMPKFNTTE